MKNITDYSNDSGLCEQLRQQIGLITSIDSFQVARTANQTGMLRTAFSLQPSMMHPEGGHCPAVNPVSVEGALLKTMQGVVRSFIFFNWKDHA